MSRSDRIQHAYEPISNEEPLSADDQLVHSTDRLIGSHGRKDTRVYWAFWILGAGVLLSWNVLICSIPLLSTFLPSGSSSRANLASYLSTVYCFGNLFFLGLAQRSVGKIDPTVRLRRSLYLLLSLSVAFVFPILPFILPSLPPALVFLVLLIMAFGLSISTAYLQSAVFALAALWPIGPNSTLGVMSGQGGIAVLVSGIQCALAILHGLSSSNPSQGTDEGGEHPSTIAGVGLWVLCAAGAMGCLVALGNLEKHQDYEGVIQRGSGTNFPELDMPGSYNTEKGRTKRVFRKNIRLEAAVAWVFVVTLSVFPPITTAILSTHVPTPKLLQPGIFIPLHFFIFNIGDYVGRTYAPSVPALFITSQKRIITLSLARTLFVPLFLLCNVVTPSANAASAPFINSDTIYFSILLLFGTTNGWISSLCMITASSPELNPRIEEHEKDVAGTMAAFCLVAGLAGGSLASFGVNWAVRGSFL